MALVSLQGTAQAQAQPTAQPNFRWSLVSTAAVVGTPAVASPHKLNVDGEIGQIPYFDFGTDR